MTTKPATPESSRELKLYRRDFLGAMAAGLAGAGLGLRAGPATAAEPPAWKGIAVEVKSDQPVATAQSLKEQADGFHRLSITLSNPAMDETVPLDLWRHATSKGDGFELVLARKGRAIYFGVFNWSDTAKEYTPPAFGKPEPLRLAGRHSAIVKCDGNDSFARLCQKLQSR